MVCGCCGRKIKDPVSLKIGYGPVCRKKMGISNNRKKKNRRNLKPVIKDFDIPGQTSIYDHPDWLPDHMKGDNRK